jgi:M6 family metalloprotease-like protein
MSVPFFGKEFTFKQPDGSELPVRGWGNQERAVFETLDGFTVVKDPITGFYQYAAVSDDGNDLKPTGFEAVKVNPRNLGLAPKLRPNRVAPTTPPAMSSRSTTPRKTRWETRREVVRMQQRAALMSPTAIMAAPPHRQTVGDFVGLCLLVDFPDVPATISQAEVEAFCNLAGYNGFGNNGSVYDYFFDNSGGKLRYTNIVAPYYIAQHNRDYYTDDTQPYGIRAQELIREALDHLRAQGFDFSPLTVDAGKYVYATSVFYSGPVVNNWSKGLWPHASRLVEDYQLMPGKIAADYQITNMGGELTLGTFCHENGHMICDFPDLYDYSKDGVYSHGVGSFCLMCVGANVNQKNPTQVNAYLKYRAGWAKSVTPITAGLTATIRAGVNEFFIHKKNQREYFIIENRQKTGRDQGLPGSGLAIWHIDELGDNENQGRTANSHYECSIVQADGAFDLEHGEGGQYGEAVDLYFGGGTTKFNGSTNPNSQWWNGAPSGLDISDISANGSSMTFKATV